MGDQATFRSNNPTSDAAALDKGKGKAVEDPMDMSMDEEEEDSDDSDEELAPEADEDEAEDNLEPISTENIISGGRRTRGKNIDFREAAEKYSADAMEDSSDEDEDEDFAPRDDNKMHG